MKIAFSLFSLLLFMNTIILVLQYQVYSSDDNEQISSYTFTQEVNVTYREGRLVILHDFFSLPNQAVTIDWPLSSENRGCHIEGDVNCSRLSDDLTKFEKGEASRQTISYEIPVQEPLNNQQLWKDVFAFLSDGKAGSSVVHVTDETKVGGMWLTGLPVIGKKTLSLVDYTLFNGMGAIGDLYWQKEILPTVYKDQQLSLYASQPIEEEVRQALITNNTPEINQHISVIETINGENLHAHRLVFIPSANLPNFEEELIIRSVKGQYTFSAKSIYSLETVASFLTNQAVGTQKSKAMYESLVAYMTKLQKEEWTSQLFESKGQTISPELLDEWLTEILSLKTSFFVMNEQSATELLPLLFEETRSIFINELENKDMTIIFSNGRVLYSVKPMLSLFGYEMKETTTSFYIQNAARAFRFPLKEPFYVFNERRYDALSQPIEKIGESYYIEESWLIRLFLIDIQKEENQINISPSTLF